MLLLISIFSLAFDIQPARTDAITITVPDNYATIQEAIDSANPWDTIFVRNGTYYEHLVIGKPVFLIGEDKNTTIIDGSGIERVVFITSYNVAIFNFTITNGDIGLFIRYSGNTTLRDNNLYGNNYNFAIEGRSIVSDWIQDIDTSNLVDGKPVYYWVNQHNRQVPTDAGFVTIVGSSNITVRNLNLTKVGTGVFLLFTNHSLVENVRVHDNYYAGVSLHKSNHNIIRNNLITSNGYRGIILWFALAYNNLIYNNTIVDNGWREGAWENGGVVFHESSNNIVHHNNFLNNTIHADANGYANSWDNGVEGNYWDNYLGLDSDQDGIGDTPYIIDGNNQDNYPLMSRYWNPSDINHDLKIDIKDIATAALAFGSYPSHERWNPHADITGSIALEPDGQVDIRDIALIALHFGEEY